MEEWLIQNRIFTEDTLPTIDIPSVIGCIVILQILVLLLWPPEPKAKIK